MPTISRDCRGSPLNIVVVESHDDVRQSTIKTLVNQGYVVHGAATGATLDALLTQTPVELLVLDINLPNEDGLQIARRMRDSRPDIGIIIVTARSRADDKVAGYASGADLYLAKPVSPDELCAAIEAVARRLRQRADISNGITLNRRTRQLAGMQGNVDVSRREVDLLIAFTEATDSLLDTPQLIAIAGVTNDEAGKHTLEVQLVRLRKKLEQAGALAPTIKSIRSQGYQLCVPIGINQFHENNNA